MSQLTRTEPAVTIGLVTAAVLSVVVLLVAFGVDVTEEQALAIAGVIAGVGPLVQAFLTRARVVPTGNVAVKVERGDTSRDDVLVAGDGVANIATGDPVEVFETLPPNDEAIPDRV